jgi:hypothetical protein
MPAEVVEINEIQPQDSGAVRREKINANFLLLLGLQSLTEPIMAINQSVEVEKIGRDRIGPLAITDEDIDTVLAWELIDKAGSSLGDLADRDAGDLTSGTLGAARLPVEAARLDVVNLFTEVTQRFGAAIGAIDINTIVSFLVTNLANKPGIRFKGTGSGTGRWELTNDGTTWLPIDTATGGAGISSLNGQTGASQTFGNDTNVTITSNTNVHTLGWNGQLSIARGGTASSTATGARGNIGAAGLADQNRFTKRQEFNRGADIASASALAIGLDGNFFAVTGSTQITSIAAAPAGTEIALHFNEALNIVHSGALILWYSQNYTTEPGDVLRFISTSPGLWRQIGYAPATRFRPSGAVRCDVHSTARLVIPVGANKFAT